MEREEKQRRAEEARHKIPAASSLPAAAEAQRKAAAAAAAARDRMRREQTNLIATRRLQHPQPGRGPVGRRLDEANSTEDRAMPTLLGRLNSSGPEAARARRMRDIVSDQLRGAATGLVRRSGDAGRESRDRRTRFKMLLVALARFPQRLPLWVVTLLFMACVTTAGFCGYLCTRAVLDSYDAGSAGADHFHNRARPLRPPPPPRDMEFGRAPRKQASRPPFVAGEQGSDGTADKDAAQQHGLRYTAPDARGGGGRQCKQARQHSVV